MITVLGRLLYDFGHQPRTIGHDSLPPRPAGILAWLHAPDEHSLPAMIVLAHRLHEEDGIEILLTAPPPCPVLPDMLTLPAPADNFHEASTFFDHWRPDIVVLAGGEIRPALVIEARKRELPLLMVNARAPFLPEGRSGRFPGIMRRALESIDRIIATDAVASVTLRRAGANYAALSIGGEMEEPSTALPCIEAEREALAEMTAARPIWFAAAVPESEEMAVLAAHRAVQALTHRLLLIFLPENASRMDEIAARFESAGFSVAQRRADEEPLASTEIYLVDDLDELGLWYRLAPITFLGGSLEGKGPIRNPQEAAALGSAILHGPQNGQHEAILRQLDEAHAARKLSSEQELAKRLEELISPNNAAQLAAAAWGVISRGAETTAGIINLIRRMLDGEDR